MITSIHIKSALALAALLTLPLAHAAMSKAELTVHLALRS